MIPCERCAQPMDETARFCPSCGAARAVAEQVCSQCGGKPKAGVHFCPDCGAAVKEEQRRDKLTFAAEEIERAEKLLMPYRRRVCG